ncbi:MAG: class I SAM-dependent methyltransferase [Methanobacterium sp.]|nr:class I SAM-dependent methyltransferase [Methanobacterium sp.]
MSTALFIFLVAISTLTIVLIWIFWSFTLGAGWEPTSKRVVKKMLEMAEASSDDIVYDLGSGDGRIVIEAAKRYDSMAVGIEADPIRVLWSRIMVRISRLQNNVKIKWGNIFNQNIDDATVVTLFLWKNINQKLKPKLLDELKPGTRVVSYIWTFEGWEPSKSDNYEHIYLYIIGESDK